MKGEEKLLQAIFTQYNPFEGADKNKKLYLVKPIWDKTSQICEYAYINDEWVLMSLVTFNSKYQETVDYYLNLCEEAQSLAPMYKKYYEKEGK